MMGRQSRLRDMMKYLNSLPKGQRERGTLEPVNLKRYQYMPKRSGKNTPPRPGNRISEKSMQRRRNED